MKVATRSFKFTDAHGSGEVVKGERVDDSHELVRMFPEAWRDFGLDDELKVRSTRVAELREAAARPAGREPLSQGGREARREDNFWRSVEQQLERTHDDGRTSEERREQTFYDTALRQLEDADAAKLRELTHDLTEAWQGRLPAA